MDIKKYLKQDERLRSLESRFKIILVNTLSFIKCKKILVEFKVLKTVTTRINHLGY